MSRLTARYCLSFLILTKDLSTYLAFISNLSYFYVRKRIFIRHSESCLFLRKKETTFFLSSLHSQYLPFYFLFYIFMHFAFCLFTNHYSFNISDLLSGKARTKPHDTRRGYRVTSRMRQQLYHRMTGLIRIRSVILLGGLHPHTFAIERDRHFENVSHPSRMERGGVLLLLDLRQGGIKHLVHRLVKHRVVHFQLHDKTPATKVTGTKKDVVTAQTRLTVTAHLVRAVANQHSQQERLIDLSGSRPFVS